MRITTWNVNGLRAALRKGLKEWVLAEQPDVMCLQEIKARPEQLSEAQREVPGYHLIWNPAERPGYSGVATWTREVPQEVTLGLGEPRFDVEGRLIRTRHDGFLLFNVYFPNGQRGQERVEYKLAFYARLLEICDSLHAAGEQVIITGDFNTAHRPIDLRNPKENANTSGFLPEERAWIDRYLEHGFVDVYRHLYPERVQYTWWTYRFNARRRNIGWRLDYFLVSESLVSRVRDVVIHEEVMGSDHCPVSLWLD
ncbi:MAG: exodeoxyribonuclease III [Anaerolineae bacterium]|nr:MAG: exodeoxyribonuclease III [Anaerolineae bacterium]